MFYDTEANPVSQLLDGTVESLDIPEHLHRAAVAEYNAVGDWLSQHAEPDGAGWHVYPQGSIVLGTVVRPLGRDEYDVDSVCQRGIAKQDTTQTALKDDIGTALGNYVEARGGGDGAPVGCEERKRCWTLSYSQPFHLDVLPAIPAPDRGPTAIRLTDRELVRWQHSDPKAFADWFRRSMAEELTAKRSRLAEAERTAPEDIPEYRVRTTLQRVVQVLKHHRSMYFANYPDLRPASILVTTLAAHSYRGEQDLYAALLETVELMPDYIERDGGRWSVPNPVEDRENFADKWNTEPQLARGFHEWLRQLEVDLRGADEARGLDRIADRLSESFGADHVKKAARRIGEGYRAERESGRLGFAPATGVLSGAGAKKVKDHDFYGQSGS
jgi:hypothetical protein